MGVEHLSLSDIYILKVVRKADGMLDIVAKEKCQSQQAFVIGVWSLRKTWKCLQLGDWMSVESEWRYRQQLRLKAWNKDVRILIQSLRIE